MPSTPQPGHHPERSTLHVAAVVTPTAVHYGDGTMIAADIAHNLPRLLAGTLGRFEPHSTIVVDARPSGEHTRQLDAVRAAGWSFGTGPDDSPGAWSLYHRDSGHRTVAVGYRPRMQPGRHFGVLFDADTDPGVLALRLDRFIRLCGGWSWRGTPATTGHAALRLTWPHSAQQPLWNDGGKGPGRGVGALDWRRNLTSHEREWGFLHRFDANSAYLGACINATVAWSGLAHTGPIPFDRNVPGYWLIGMDGLPDWPDDGRPPLFDTRAATVWIDGRAAVWVTTPYAELIAELGGSLAVVDSWTGGARGRTGFAAGHRVLRGWAERIRDARAGAAMMSPPGGPALAVAVKRLYKDALGGMQRPGMRVYRPDWAHTVIDLWRATLIRRVLRVHATQGVWPVAVATDSITYADCLPTQQGPRRDPTFPNLTDALSVVSCAVPDCGCITGPKSTALGAYKHDAVWTVQQWDELHAPKQVRVPRPRRPRNSSVDLAGVR